MNCSDAQQALSLRLDGELSPEEAGWLARHLEECAPCQGEEVRLRALDRHLRALPPVPATSPRRRPRLAWAAAVVLALGVGTGLLWRPAPAAASYQASIHLDDTRYEVQLYGEHAQLLSLELCDGPGRSVEVDFSQGETP